MNGAVMRTGAAATLGGATQATTAAAPVYYFGFMGNATPGGTVVISNLPGCGPSTASTTHTSEVTQLVSAMATYTTASCCCVSPAPLASTGSPLLLASAH